MTKGTARTLITAGVLVFWALVITHCSHHTAQERQEAHGLRSTGDL